MDRVRVGIVGAGHNAQHWLDDYQRLKEAEVVAISDLWEERARATAAKYKIPNFFSGDAVNEIYAREDIDLISIHTSDHLHADPFVRALQSGKHVVVEKPMG